jgi:hypothetical protein
MNETELDSFTDAFGSKVTLGDYVVYVAQERLKKGVVERIIEVQYNSLGYSITRTRIYIRFSNKYKTKYGGTVQGVSPLEHPERIMKL